MRQAALSQADQSNLTPATFPPVGSGASHRNSGSHRLLLRGWGAKAGEPSLQQTLAGFCFELLSPRLSDHVSLSAFVPLPCLHLHMMGLSV